MDVSIEPEIKDSQSNSKLTIIKPDIKTNIETDSEKYEFFTNSLSERRFTNELNDNLDNENQLDNGQLDELTRDFYNIRVKYYNIKYQVEHRKGI